MESEERVGEESAVLFDIDHAKKDPFIEAARLIPRSFKSSKRLPNEAPIVCLRTSQGRGRKHTPLSIVLGRPLA